MPIAFMLLFVFVFGGAIGRQTGSVSYVDYITPGIVIMAVVSGISYAAFRLSGDLHGGMISRFRTMPVAPVSILGGQALSSTLSNLLSSVLVILTAFVVGFRSHAGIEQWLMVAGLVLLFTFATTWLAIFFGLLANTPEGAGAFSYILLLLIFISPAFVPATSITPALRGFAQNQPMTPIVETMRSLLTSGVAGSQAGPAVLWSVGILVVSFSLALIVYRRKNVVVLT
jgi:ABC-2 type transport system permease protein